MTARIHLALSQPEIITHFALDGATLLRRLSDGTVKPVTSIARGTNEVVGKLAPVLGGRKLSGPEVAWTLIYGHVPLFPVHQLNGDPFDMSRDNLMPVRTRRLLYRPIAVGAGWRHALSANVFATKEACHDSWVKHAREHYKDDLGHVLDLAAKMAVGRTPEAYSAKPKAHTPKAYRPRKYPTQTKRPTKVAGKLWYWFEGQWVLVPPPCHPADDYRLRCAAVLQGAEEFAYDRATERVVVTKWAQKE